MPSTPRVTKIARASRVTVMRELDTNDVVIRLDPPRSMVQLLVKKTDGTLDLFYEASQETLLEMGGFERGLGVLVLGYFSAKTKVDIFNLEDYRRGATAFQKELDEEAAELLSSEDSNSVFEGALLRLDRFDDTWTLQDLDDMESLIRHAADGGSEAAQVFLKEKWPERVKILRRRITR
ncbi:hypothetical protein GCM10010971_41630 [Silvimonas amylolytica]|uniref:Uncharacterized protein n=2 Tax=Silvimonas amylolytica TaxID=449663 RepID=A0ABQ2PSV1_9NEIS|nr:hypothetical protein GCM10010971_41630 [Silvimonas amylolytica]